MNKYEFFHNFTLSGRINIKTYDRKVADKIIEHFTFCFGFITTFKRICQIVVFTGVVFFIILNYRAIGTIIAFTALIPVVGAFIGCAVGAFLILMDSPEKALLFIVIFLILQQIEGNLIYPKVVGGSVGLPSMWVLFAVTVGSSLMGVAGMLFFIPLTSVIYSLIKEWTYKRLKDKSNDL